MFGVADYWTLVAAVIVFLAIPGVGNLAIITSTSKGRVTGGLAATFGVIAGDQVLMWLAVAGVLTANPALFGLVQYAGAIYLAYLGVQMILAQPGDAPVLKMQPHIPLSKGDSRNVSPHARARKFCIHLPLGDDSRWRLLCDFPIHLAAGSIRCASTPRR